MAWVVGSVLLSTLLDRFLHRPAVRIAKAGEAEAARRNVGARATTIVERVLDKKAS